MNTIDNIPDQGQSIMELACQQAQTFGLTPEPRRVRLQGRLG